MDLPDLTSVTDDELREAADEIAAERDKRAVLAQAIDQGTELALKYRDAGGVVEDALAQIAANVAAAPAPDSATPPADPAEPAPDPEVTP